jgi:hypothetical protein
VVGYPGFVHFNIKRKEIAMNAIAKPSSFKETELGFDPNDLVDWTGKLPSFHFEWREPGKKKGEKLPPNRKKKRRKLCIPNRAMRLRCTSFFKVHLEMAIDLMGDESDGSDNYTLRRLPSATGCVSGSNHFKNSAAHISKKFFYVTDFAHAYPSVDLKRLTMLLVYIFATVMYGQRLYYPTFRT